MMADELNEFQVMRAISTTTLSQRLIDESGLSTLMTQIAKSNKDVSFDTGRLERARREQKEGNVVSNWWNDRADAIQDAHLDLSKSIGRLTQDTTKLVVVNTALAKVLNFQQEGLASQQAQLQEQASRIESQNRQLADQHEQLGAHQLRIDKANQALLELHGVNQDQAIRLLGCVERMESSEVRFATAERELLGRLERQSAEVVRCLDAVAEARQQMQVLATAGEALERKLRRCWVSCGFAAGAAITGIVLALLR